MNLFSNPLILIIALLVVLGGGGFFLGGLNGGGIGVGLVVVACVVAYLKGGLRFRR